MAGSSLSEGELREQLAELLRFFIESNRVGVVDRFGLALSPEAVTTALYEALRTVRALRARSVKLVLEVPWAEERKLELECCEYGVVEKPEEASPFTVHGKVLFSSSPTTVPQGSYAWCARCPRMPSEDALGRLFELLESDPVRALEVAREAASMAFAFRRKREVGG